MGNSNKEKGTRYENKVKNTINSGSLWFSKGDLQDNDFVIDTKYTEKKGYRITSKLLEKLWDDALNSNKMPKLIIGIEEDKYRWMLEVNINKEIK